MRSLFRYLSLSLCLVSCAAQENFSALKEFKDIKSAEKRSDGLYNVQCMDGSLEIGVTLEAITANAVCNSAAPEPMNTGLPLYTQAEKAAVSEVFSDLGELHIDPVLVGSGPDDRNKVVIYSAQGAGLPWAAYWYPRRGKDMFEEPSAPLRKLDVWLNALGKSSWIAGWEEEYYDAYAAEWEGLSDAWAMAAVSTLEPTKAMTIDSVDFSAADLKAIALKYFEGYRAKTYGRRYQGVLTDGEAQDLRPEAFHRIVEEYMGRQQKPIIVDDDPDAEVWSKPVFRYAFFIYKDPARAQALIVRAFPWMIRQRESVDGSPTSIATDLAAPTYEYRLHHDLKLTKEGKLKIIAGEWLNDSKISHPDMVFLPESAEHKGQLNSEFRKHAEDIRKLLHKAGMVRP